MRICFFTENYYKGGLDTFIINLVNAWPNESDSLTLLTNDTHLGLNAIAEETEQRVIIRTYRRIFTSATAQGLSRSKLVRSKQFQILISLTFRLLQFPILFPWYVLTLFFFFRSCDFDRLMVINGGYPASLICRSAVIAWRLAGKRPLAVMNFHNSTVSPHWYNRLFENYIDSLVIKSISHIVTVSKNCQDSLSNRTSFLNCSKLSFIYNGIRDPKALLKTATNVPYHEFSPSRYCLMLATYEARKGHAYLLQAFQIVIENFPDVQLKIYGHGLPHEKKQVSDEVIRLKLENNVSLGDFTSQTAELLAGASVLVVPSQSYESFGLTIIEAMAFGVPVIATDVGGMPEVLEGSNAGYICSKNDPLEFADAIIKILKNHDLASELGRNGRQTFERRFTADKMALSYRKLID